MTRPLYPFFGLGLLALLASCAGPVASSSGRDAWGHRPGPRGFTTVIIDAGHGGKDSGAPSKTTGQQEKDLTLDMAKRIRAQLSGNFHTILMRSDDTFVDLDDRVARANQYGDAILVSMHFNSGPRQLHGPETYYWRVDSHGLAVRLQRAMVQASPAEHSNRGLVRRRLRLTRNPEIPCVLMAGGYLSHPAAARLICCPDYRQRPAVAISSALRT
ncbi:MAG: N-acetylmuramoyl-L-alanine amidase, partial [Verrucomicrobiota bacterium]